MSDAVKGYSGYTASPSIDVDVEIHGIIPTAFSGVPAYVVQKCNRCPSSSLEEVSALKSPKKAMRNLGHIYFGPALNELGSAKKDGCKLKLQLLCEAHGSKSDKEPGLGFGKTRAVPADATSQSTNPEPWSEHRHDFCPKDHTHPRDHCPWLRGSLCHRGVHGS